MLVRTYARTAVVTEQLKITCQLTVARLSSFTIQPMTKGTYDRVSISGRCGVSGLRTPALGSTLGVPVVQSSLYCALSYIGSISGSKSSDLDFNLDS